MISLFPRAPSIFINKHNEESAKADASFITRSLKSAMGAGQSCLSLDSCFEFLFTFLSRRFFIQHITNPHLPRSRPAIKKYILANNKSTAATAAVFDSQFNKALRTGVEKGDFTQPKGTVYSPESCLSNNITT